MRTVVLCCLVILTVASLAAPLGKSISPEEREASALNHRQSVIRMLAALELNEAQQANLLPILRAQVTAMSAIRDAKIKAQPSMEQAMQNLRQAVFVNNGVADKVRNAVYAAEDPYTVPYYQLLDDQEGRVEAIWVMLATTQGACLRRGGSTEDEWKQSVLGAITTPRNDPARALRWLYNRYGLRDAEVERAVEFGRPIITKWQEQPDLDTPQRKLAYLHDLLALPQQGLLNEKPDDDTENSILYFLLTQKTLHYLTGEAPLPPIENDETETVRTLTADVQVMNMLNSLYLTDGQMTALLDLNRQAKARFDRTEAERVAICRSLLPILRQIVETTERKQTISPAMDAVYAGCKNAFNLLNADDAQVNRDGLAELKRLLTLNQLAMASSFVPCTVPVQSLAKDNSGMERELAEIRAVPEADVEQATARLQERMKKDFRSKHYGEEVIIAAVASVPTVVADASAMADAEFALKKSVLAKGLSMPVVRPVYGEALDDRLIDFLLSPNLIPILEKWLAQR